MEVGVVVLMLFIFALIGIVNSVKKSAKRPGAAETDASFKEKSASEPLSARRETPAEKSALTPDGAPARAQAKPAARGQLTAKDMRRAFVMSEILREPVSMREDRR